MLISLFLSTVIFFNFILKDAKTDLPISDVQVVCTEHHEGGIADENGVIRLQLKPGKHRFRVSHIGYKSQTIELKLPGIETSQMIYLVPRILPLRGVEITAPIEKTPDTKIINSQILQRTISVGEPDILRALQILPGISSNSDYSSAPVIRGLPANYSRIFLGNAPVLNPFHVGGLFSCFDYGMIGQAKISPGYVSPEYGDYGSGLIQLYPRFSTESETQIELGLVSTSLRLLRKPFHRWKSGLSMRYFSLDLFYRLITINNNRLDYAYWDIWWTNQYDISEEFQLNWNCYYTHEELPNSIIPKGRHKEIVRKKPGYGNLVLSLDSQWKSFYLNFYHSAAPMEMETNRNWIHNIISKDGIQFSYQRVNPNGWFKAGLAVEQNRLHYHWHFGSTNLDDIIGPPQYSFFDDAPPDYRAVFNYRTTAAFLDYKQILPFKTEISAGWRLEDYRHHLYSMPRITIERPVKNWQFVLGYGLVYQYHYTLKEKSNMEIFSPYTIRFPATSKPIDITSYTFQIIPPLKNFSAVYYWRNFNNIPIYDWNSYQHLRTYGFSTGLELSWEQKIKRMEWQVNYTLATSRMAWQKEWHPMSLDRRHHLKMNLDLPFNNYWRWGFQFQFATGYPYSPVTHWVPSYTEAMIFNGVALDFIPRFGKLNSARYPGYHRLDFSVEHNWYFFNSTLTLRFVFLNVYNHNNLFYYNYTYDYFFGMENYSLPHLEKINNFPMLPSLYLVYKF